MNAIQPIDRQHGFVQKVSFPLDLTILYDGAKWIGDEDGSPDGHTLSKVHGRETRFLTHRRVGELIASNDLRVRPRNLADAGIATKKAAETRDFECYTPEQKLHAEVKKKYVFAWEKGRGHNPSRKRSISAITQAKTETEAFANDAAAKLGIPAPKVKIVGLSTLYSWKAELAEAERSGILVDRRSEHSGNRSKRLSMKQERILDMALERWLTTNQKHAELIFEEIEADIRTNPEFQDLIGVPFPSMKTFLRRKDAIPQAQIDYARLGEEYFVHTYHSTGTGFEKPRPGMLLQIDGKILDVHTICGGLEEYKRLSRKQRKALKTVRVVVVAIICVATRAIVGFAVGLSESTKVTKKALRVAFSDKADLVRGAGAESDWPMRAAAGARIVSDNGSGTLEEFTAAAINLHSFHQKATLGQPWLRAHVERFFRTLAHRFFPIFTALAFGPKQTKPTAATIFTNMVPALFTRFIVDRYHRRTHSGIGLSPYAAWCIMSEASPPPPAMDPDRLSAIMGEEMEVPANPDGIEVAGLHYQSSELQAVVEHLGLGRDVTIKFDFENVGQISVRLPRGNCARSIRPLSRGRPALDQRTLHQWIEGCFRFRSGRGQRPTPRRIRGGCPYIAGGVAVRLGASEGHRRQDEGRTALPRGRFARAIHGAAGSHPPRFAGGRKGVGSARTY